MITGTQPARRIPPGPRGHFLIGHMPEFRKDPLGFFSGCAREYGDVVRLSFATLTFYLVSHPDAIEDVLVTQSKKFVKSWDYRYLLKGLLGNGLLTSEGDVWLRQRRLAQPSFHRERIDSYAETMVAYTQQLLATWRDGETREIHREMMRLTVQIVSKVLFGADVDREAVEVRDALSVVTQHIVELTNSPLPIPGFLPTPGNLRWKRAIRRLDDIVYGLIRKQRERRKESGDLLSTLLQAQDEDGSRMTDRQVRDEVMTLFLAGQETTALALSWTFYLLGGYPDVEAALQAELRTVLGGRAPRVTDLAHLGYTERVVKESMRLFPPVWGIGREALTSCTIAGYPVPKRTQILMSQYVVHRDPRWFAEPERFRPERWTEDIEKHLPAFAYFPFGGGPRHCIGHAFAMTEAVLLLAAIVQRFRLRLVPDHPVVPLPSITLRPKHGIQVVLARR